MAFIYQPVSLYFFHGGERRMEGGGSRVLLCIALDQEALVLFLSFHVQLHSVHLLFLKTISSPPPSLLSSPFFPSERRSDDSSS